MNSTDDGLEPDMERHSLDWLDAPGVKVVSEDSDSGIILLKCDDAGVSAVLTDVPPFRKLAFLCGRSLSLSAAPDIALPDHVVVSLVVNDDMSTHCEVLMPVKAVECSLRPSAEESGQAQHILGVSDNTHVLIEGGSWELQHQGAQDDAAISLEVKNRNEPLTVVGGVPVDSLVSTGDHEYHLDFAAEADVVVVDGTATFARPLRTVSMSGSGDAKALRGMHDCQVDGAGGLEVHREIVDCEVAIGGRFEALGPVRLGERSLRCGDTNLSGDLESAADVTCKELRVQGSIELAGTLSVESVNCDGALTAERVVASGDIHFSSNVTCQEMRGSGSITLVGDPSGVESLTWSPVRAAQLLSIYHPASRLSRVLIDDGASHDVEPSMRLAAGVEIDQLHVDVDALTVEAAQFNSSNESDMKSTIGLQPARKDSLLQLSQGKLELRLAHDIPRFAIDAASGTKVDVVELPSDVSAVSIRGDGEVRFADDASSARLRHVRLVGRLRFSSAANIDRLSAAAWPSDTTEALAEESNDSPSLNLEPGVVVKAASGMCRLEHLEAKIYGDPVRDFVIEQVASPGRTEGHLTNANVNELPEQQIPLLTHLRVLEISGDSLRRYAGERTWLRCSADKARRFLSGSWRTQRGATGQFKRPEKATGGGEPLTAVEIRSRAETVAQLSEILGGKVNSGDSRTRLHWAVARLQHRSLNRWAPERAFRAAYRWVGYGYRPLPALATWAAVSLVGLLFGVLGGFTAQNEIQTSVAGLGRFVEILLMPIGYLRLGSTGTTSMFEPNAVDLLSRLLIGLPFLFSILSIRQYFRSPVGQRSQPDTM